MPPKPTTKKINEIFQPEVPNRERQSKKGKPRFAANALANKKSNDAKASDLPSSFYNKIDTHNPNEPFEAFSTSSDPSETIPTPTNRHQSRIPQPPPPSISTEESIMRNSFIPSLEAQGVLVSQIETHMCTNFHDPLYSTLVHILQIAGLLQYVDLSTLVQIAQHPEPLYTNLTLNSQYCYIYIPFKGNCRIESRHLYANVSSRADNRFGSTISNQFNKNGIPKYIPNKAPLGLSNYAISHTIALTTSTPNPQCKVLIAARNFMRNLSNYICMRMLHLVTSIESSTVFTVLSHTLENEYERSKSAEPCVVVLVPSTTTSEDMKALREAFLAAHPQDFIWSHIHTRIKISATLIPGLPLEITTNISTFIGQKFLKIYKHNYIEINGVIAKPDEKTIYTALLKIVPHMYIVCIVSACYISDKTSTYYVFLNSMESTTVNLDPLSPLKAPSETITYICRTSLSGPTCSKFALPYVRDTTKQPSPRQQMHQDQPESPQHPESNERTPGPMMKTLLEEVRTTRSEMKLLNDKVDILTVLIKSMGESYDHSTSTVQSSEQISPARKKSSTSS